MIADSHVAFRVLNYRPPKSKVARTMDILQLARVKIAALRQELADLETFERKARELADAAGHQQLPEPQTPLEASAPPPEGKMQLIVRLAAEIVSKDGAKQTHELVERLAKNGVTFGANSRGELSAYLSRSKRFDNRRKDGGWFIKEG